MPEVYKVYNATKVKMTDSSKLTQDNIILN